MALNDYLFKELRFVGNDVQYEDPRNSFLNEVLDRRTGIPITLALMYMEVARRAGLHVEGINFPGHFLLRCPARRGTPYSEDLIIDAFHGGALLSEDACRELLRRHAGDEAVFESHLLRHATKPQILARMLLNLKRVYVRMHCSRRRATSPSCFSRSIRRPTTSCAIADSPVKRRTSPRARPPGSVSSSSSPLTKKSARSRENLGARQNASQKGRFA
jgi:hypothetical protein